MMEYTLDRIAHYSAPPTRESIERLKALQLEAIRRIRQELLDVQPVCTAA